MQVFAYPFPGAVSEKQLYGKTVIVVDVLRATTTMVEALRNGAKQVIPARDPSEAIAYMGHLGRRESILAGERGGLKLPDFDLGNSPLEFTEDAVKGKSVVMSTTNGTVAIHAARGAAKLYIGSMRNATAAAKAAVQEEKDIVVLCAGTLNESSADDIVAAGCVLKAIMQNMSEEPHLNDFARVCLLVYGAYKRGEADLSVTTHYSHLKEIGFENDLKFCFEEDKTEIVPRYENGCVRI